jgi:hypothetical protein
MAGANPVIDGKYEVRGQCSNAGGMGTLLFVTAVGTEAPVLVLKLCKLTDPEMLARFRREVRVMQQFTGNSYVMPILDANLDHEPPIGYCLFVGMAIGGVGLAPLARAIMPFIVMMLVVLMTVTFWPAVALSLVR